MRRFLLLNLDKNPNLVYHIRVKDALFGGHQSNKKMFEWIAPKTIL